MVLQLQSSGARPSTLKFSIGVYSCNSDRNYMSIAEIDYYIWKVNSLRTYSLRHVCHLIEIPLELFNNLLTCWSFNG